MSSNTRGNKQLVSRTDEFSAVSGSRRAHLTYRRLLRSEFTKLWSQSSVKLLLLIAAAGAVLLSTFSAAGQPAATGHPAVLLARVAESNIVNAATAGMGLINVLIVVAGVIVAASEFDAKTAAITFTAVPRRYPVVIVRCVLMGATGFVTGAVIVVCGGLVTIPGLIAGGLELRFWSPNVLGAYLGAAMFLSLSATIGVCLGTLLRSMLGGIIVAFALVSVLPAIVMVLDVALELQTIGFARFLPSPFTASTLWMYADPEHGTNGLAPPPGVAIAVFLGWIGVTGALALWRLRRDVV